MTELVELTSVIKIPEGTFEGIPKTCRFIGLKKKKSDVIKLIPVKDPEARIYEIYAEMKKHTSSTTPFIITLGRLVRKIDGIVFVPEMEGVCPGSKDKEVRCTFNGFLLVTAEESVVTELKEQLMMLESGDHLVVKTLSIEEIS